MKRDRNAVNLDHGHSWNCGESEKKSKRRERVQALKNCSKFFWSIQIEWDILFGVWASSVLRIRINNKLRLLFACEISVNQVDKIQTIHKYLLTFQHKEVWNAWNTSSTQWTWTPTRYHYEWRKCSKSAVDNKHKQKKIVSEKQECTIKSIIIFSENKPKKDSTSKMHKMSYLNAQVFWQVLKCLLNLLQTNAQKKSKTTEKILQIIWRTDV